MKYLGMVSGVLLVAGQMLLIAAMILSDLDRWYAVCLAALAAMIAALYAQNAANFAASRSAGSGPTAGGGVAWKQPPTP